MVGELSPLSEERRAFYKQWSRDEQVLLKQAFYEMQTKKRFESAEKLDSEESQITTWLGTELPPVHIYRAPFETEDRDIIESDFSPEAWSELKSIAKEKKCERCWKPLRQRWMTLVLL
jgi:hypothetical protein